MSGVRTVNGKMEAIESKGIQIEVKTINNDGILLRNTKKFSDKGEEVKTTEYYLDVQHQNVDSDINPELIAVEEACENNDNEQFIAVEMENSDDISMNNKQVIIWGEICRICANTNEQFIPIFNGEGIEHDLYNKINNYLPVKISEDDNLPQQVCYNCAATLLTWHDLFKGCIEAEHRLTELKNKISSREEFFNEATPEEEEENEETVEEIETGNETVNNEEYETEPKLERVEEDQQEQEQEEEDEGNLEKSRSANICIYSGTPLLNSFDKDFEIKEFSVESVVRKCSIENVEGCLIIASSFCQSPQLIPDRSVNNSPTSSIDSVPPKKSKSTTKSRRGFRRREIQTTTICNECGQKFRTKDTLRRHMRIHSDERPFTCYVCGKQFRDSGGVCRHLRDVHIKIKRHACAECGRCFASKATRDDHIRTHTNERPYTCNDCGKTFKAKASLYTHSKIHTNDFPYACLECDKKFRRRQELACHLAIHTGKKNFVCNVCSKRFRVKSELKLHVLVHSDNKPFVCDICGFSCRQQRYLNNHIRHKHPTIQTEQHANNA